MNDYEQGFYDARDGVLSLIDEWYEEYHETIDHLPAKFLLSFLKRAISDADIMDAE